MKVHVYAVEPHVAGSCLSHYGVQVGAVIVAESACFVDDLRDLENVLVEEAYGVGVGEPEAGGIFAYGISQSVQIHAAVLS